MKARSLVVGLGKIGIGYDYDCDSEDVVKTHGKALHLHPDFELVGGVDLRLDRREMFAKRYGKPIFNSLDRALEECMPEIVVVATPIGVHVETFNRVMECNSVRFILCEKPLATRLSDAAAMIQKASDKNINVAVNYIRRYDPGIRSLLHRIRIGEFGFPLKVSGRYSKGMFNNGSHLVYFLHAMLGDVRNVRILRCGNLF